MIFELHIVLFKSNLIILGTAKNRMKIRTYMSTDRVFQVELGYKVKLSQSFAKNLLKKGYSFSK